MKRNFSKALAFCTAGIISVSMLMSGCGSSTNSSSSTGTAAPSSAATSTVATESSKLPVMGDNLKYDPNLQVNDGKDITIKFWNVDSMTIYEKYAAEYSKIHPNVKFDFSKSGWNDYWKKLPLSVQSGNGPDIFYMHNAYTDLMVPSNIEPWDQSILPLDQVKADFRQVDSHIIDNKLYYTDLGMMFAGLYINKQMWADAGLKESDYPTTWDQVREVAKKLVKKDSSGKILVNGFDFNGNGVNLGEDMMYQKGQFMFNADGKTTKMNNPETISAFKYLQDIINVDKVINPKGSPCNEAFGNGRSAMIYCWSWATNYLRTSFPKLQFDFIPLPSFDGKPAALARSNGETTPCVSPKAADANKKVAFDFLKYILANNDFQVNYCINAGVAPAKKSLDTNSQITSDTTLKVLAKCVDLTIWPGVLPTAVDLNTQAIINDGIFVKNGDVATVLKKFDDESVKNAAKAKFATVERSYKNADKMK